MLELRTFGGFALRRPQQRGPQPLETQSKRLALLAYLALATPRGFHRRDTLLAMFWPDFNDSRARQALRQAVYVLRNELGEGVLVNRGDEEIGLNWDVVLCDASSFDGAVSTGDYERALEIFQGDLLPGFHVADAPDFTRFLDDERRRYRRESAAAAWTLAVRAGEKEDTVSAVRWARRAVAIEPIEEERLRTVIARLDKLGERTAAIGLFEDFARRLANEYELEPSPETVDLVTSVRARSTAVRRLTTSANRPQIRDTQSSKDDRAKVFHRRTRRAVAVVALAVAAGLSWLAFGSLLRGAGARVNAAPRIAVLPLDNLGAPEDEWFADGLTDEITSRLSNVGGLAVISRQSTTQYKGSKKSIPEIAEELEADYLLEGTVQTVHTGGSTEEVRIRPQLIKASDDTHIWADLFTVPFRASEIIGVQSDVAERVAQALNLTIREYGRGVSETLLTSNTEAYEFYLRGREYVAGAVPEEDLRVAVQMYERAVELDAQFAVAYAALAEAHLQLWWRSYDRSEERLTDARAALDQAIALDSLLPEAQIALGYYYYWGLLEFDRALETFEAVRERRPYSADLLYGIGSVLRRQGRFDDALNNLIAAADLNPKSALFVRDIANTYAYMRNTVGAEQYFHRAISLDPGWPTYMRDALQVHLRLEGSPANARRMIEEATDLGLGHPLLATVLIAAELCDSNYETALELLSAWPIDVAESNNFFIPKAQLYADVYGLLGDEELQEAYYDSSRIMVENRLRRTPDDPRVHSALGIAYAGLRRSVDALREGERAVALDPVAEDAWGGVYRVEWLAVIYAMLGEHDKALENLEYLLSIPGTLTPASLKVDYRFRALRGNPRFLAMIERYER